MRCELGRCPESATHLVHIWFPDALDETWRVCRAHDRYLKVAFSRSRPRPTPSCRQCDQPLNEPVTDAQDEVSQPCPYCGSVKRHIRVRLYDFANAYEVIRRQAKQPGKGGWLRDTTSGDDYTRDLGAWGHRTVDYDHEHNQYRELIKLYDGSQLESTAMLDNHHD